MRLRIVKALLTFFFKAHLASPKYNSFHLCNEYILKASRQFFIAAYPQCLRAVHVTSMSLPRCSRQPFRINNISISYYSQSVALSSVFQWDIDILDCHSISVIFKSFWLLQDCDQFPSKTRKSFCGCEHSKWKKWTQWRREVEARPKQWVRTWKLVTQGKLLIFVLLGYNNYWLFSLMCFLGKRMSPFLINKSNQKSFCFGFSTSCHVSLPPQHPTELHAFLLRPIKAAR